MSNKKPKSRVIKNIRYPKRNDVIELTMSEFLRNPTGKYTAYMSRRETVRKDLEARFMKLYKTYGSYFDLKIYFNRSEKAYYFKFKIPSEDYGDKLQYDVVIKFELPKVDAEMVDGDRTLTNYNIRIFSNSPNFVFTYAYVVYNSDFLVDELMGKLNDKALKDKPKVRNPIESMGYEKSCYFALLYIKHNRLIFKSNIEPNLRDYDPRTFTRTIKTDESKLKEYNDTKTLRKNATKSKKRRAKSKKRRAKRKK